jgi:hypothetical protein
MKPIWKASEHVEGPNDSDICEAGIDIVTDARIKVRGGPSTDTHYFAIAFYDFSRESAVLKRDAVLELVWASGMVDKGENV